MRKSLASITLLTPWMVWKHRHDYTFNNMQPSVPNLLAKIKEAAAMWVMASAKGLRDVWPTTWDVH